MKKYEYRVEGVYAGYNENDVDPYQRINDALCEIPLVDHAVVCGVGTHVTSLTLTFKSNVWEQERTEIEALVSACLAKEGLTLELPALSHTYVAAPAPKQGKMVSMSAAIGAMITAVILAVLCTFAVMTMNAKQKAAITVVPGNTNEEEEELQESPFAMLDILDYIFSDASPLELDKETAMKAVINAYVTSLGDPYAEYFTDEEYEKLNAEYDGEMCGIGVQVVNGLMDIDGIYYQGILISDVYADSPASEVGIRPGDFIMYIGLGEDAVLVDDIGYTMALDLLSGEEGTACEFIVYRPVNVSNGEGSVEIIEFSTVRRKLTIKSVTYTPCTTDASVGIIRIVQFTNTTASQLTEAVDALLAQGCTRFVMDLRGNPGGLLTSVIDVMTFFLEEEDLILTAKDKAGFVISYHVGKPNANGWVASGSGTLRAEEIGKYKDLDFVVLVNEYSASAAELFTANVRDYELAKIVGLTTYGKGSMQSPVFLSDYGYEGVLKMTRYFYYPPCGEGYDGIGIEPHVVVELSEEALSYNINTLPHDKDNQLQAAIALLDD